MIDAAMFMDIEEIKRLKSRYFYHLDHKEWDGWRENVFCRDASMHVPEALSEPIVGIDNILSFLIPLLDGVLTVHHGHMPDIQSSRRRRLAVSGRWKTCSSGPRDGAPMALRGAVQGYGHYHETYSRESGGWRIKTLRLSRILAPVPLLARVP